MTRLSPPPAVEKLTVFHRSRRPRLPPPPPRLHLPPPLCRHPAPSSHSPPRRWTGRARSQMSPYRLCLRESTLISPPETELLSGWRSRTDTQTFSSQRAGRANARNPPTTCSPGFFFYSYDFPFKVSGAALVVLKCGRTNLFSHTYTTNVNPYFGNVECSSVISQCLFISFRAFNQTLSDSNELYDHLYIDKYLINLTKRSKTFKVTKI